MNVDIVDILILIAGFIVLIFSGDILVRGASNIARKYGISQLIIGLTIVSLGTSAPELGVNIIAALDGSTDLSFGNITGSNITNIALILGITAIIAPIKIHNSLVIRDIPIMIIATMGMILASIDTYLDPKAATNLISRSEGFLLLGYCFFFTFIVMHSAIRSRKSQLALNDDLANASTPNSITQISLPKSLLLTFAGIAGVVCGGELTVFSAVSIAESLGISQTVIGLTVVAIATSLPELVTCVTAALKGHPDMAAGNVIGSNIYNLLLILALTAGIEPIPIPPGGMIDLFVMSALTLAIFPIAITSSQRITRTEGIFLLICYFGYMVWRVVDAIKSS